MTLYMVCYWGYFGKVQVYDKRAACTTALWENGDKAKWDGDLAMIYNNTILP